MTAGGDDDISLLVAEHSLVLGLDDGGADGGLLHVGKAQLLQGASHGLDAHAVVVDHKGRSQADDYRIAALQKDPYLFGTGLFVYSFLPLVFIFLVFIFC